jgi:hypothetical protein
VEEVEGGTMGLALMQQPYAVYVSYPNPFTYPVQYRKAPVLLSIFITHVYVLIPCDRRVLLVGRLSSKFYHSSMDRSVYVVCGRRVLLVRGEADRRTFQLDELRTQQAELRQRLQQAKDALEALR